MLEEEEVKADCIVPYNCEERIREHSLFRFCPCQSLHCPPPFSPVPRLLGRCSSYPLGLANTFTIRFLSNGDLARMPYRKQEDAMQSHHQNKRASQWPNAEPFVCSRRSHAMETNAQHQLVDVLDDSLLVCKLVFGIPEDH